MNRHANARQCWTICCRWPGFEPAKPVPRGRWKNDQHKKVHCSSPRPSSRQAQSPVNLDPSAGKSHHRLRHRHNKQAALLAASGGMRAPGRGQAAWRSILDSLQLSLFLGEISPLLKSGGPLAPTHRASPCSPHEVSPDPTPRGHHHGPALATRPRPCDVPRPGNSRPSGTSHSAIRIQISTNCPNIACHANLTAAANQRLGLALCPANAQHSTAVGCLTLDGGNLGSRVTAIHLIPPQRRMTGCQVTCIPV